MAFNVDKITIAGLGGTGKGAVIDGIKAALGFKAVSTGGFFRQMAAERQLQLSEFERLAEDDLDIDRELDRRMAAFGEGNSRIVVDGRLAHRNIPDAFKVFLSCDDQVRCQRIAERDKKPVDEVIRLEQDREAALLRRFVVLYGIKTMEELFPLDLFPAHGGFHMKIDTTGTSADEVVAMILGHRQRFI